MPNLQQIFIAKLTIFFLVFLQSFNCQADKEALQKADSLFKTKNYQEALVIYKNILQKEEAFSPAMLLKMAFISEGIGDFPSATLYLSKYYNHNPSPQIPNKIKELTNQTSLTGYTISDRDRFFSLLTDNSQMITSTLGVFLIVSMIALIMNVFRRGYFITSMIFIVLVFISNNYLKSPETGIIIGNPSLVMTQPSAAGNLIQQVGPGHRVILKSSTDIWYRIEWEDQTAYVKKKQISKI